MLFPHIRVDTLENGFEGVCDAFPYLYFFAETFEEALEGIQRLIEEEHIRLEELEDLESDFA
jgi:predicted RNase H-like HicB family nuclease